MARVVIVGGAVVGLGLGMMLARDGHDVVQLERDPQPPPDTVEKVVAELAEATPGLAVRRGVAVTGLVTGPPAIPGVPHVTGVRTDLGAPIGADVVVDASGRRSALPSWLAAAGGRPPEEDVEDSGFVYYGRHHRSDDGSLPVPLGGALQNCGSVSSLTLGADNGHWAVIVVARADDGAPTVCDRGGGPR